ncbi:hypothetical protein [Undibacterium oligocarboniphilum]|uniref:Uncharacterized protein n=1 Tax=Undibacterium oligocarboniphilum TaxID=666702 RepID=A0A850QEB7_9BURK|nr:hypothetical protein [Undibacterium oligocarboniphilum]MBC3869257.1 hypothetical protein [Undibacterium oligocarboniphilum]NVO77237.1 hypothetical protein [Undibacterium oligocarboniphilum]
MACLLVLTGWGAQLYQLVFIPYLVPVLGDAWSSAAFAASLTAVFGVLTWWMARKNWRIVIRLCLSSSNCGQGRLRNIYS